MSDREIVIILRKIENYVKNLNDKLAVPYILEKYKDPFKVLISTVISIRTREEQTIEASEKLFTKAPTPWDILELSDQELESILRKCGLYKQKVKWIKEISRRWIEYLRKLGIRNKDEYKPVKICDESFLLSLPGVGRKVLNVYLSLVCGKDVIAVDTHVHRIANRLGWVNTRTPEETEKQLYKIIPKEYWRKINRLLVLFGRNVCSYKPKCEICPIKEYCKFYKENKRK